MAKSTKFQILLIKIFVQRIFKHIVTLQVVYSGEISKKKQLGGFNSLKSSSFIILHSSFICLHHFLFILAFLHFATFKLFSQLLFSCFFQVILVFYTCKPKNTLKIFKMMGRIIRVKNQSVKKYLKWLKTHFKLIRTKIQSIKLLRNFSETWLQGS